MPWDDEAEQLTLKVIERFGEGALAGAYRDAAREVTSSDDGTPVAGIPGARWFAGDDVLRAYKARLRALLTTH